MVSYPNHTAQGQASQCSLPVLSIHSFTAILESADKYFHDQIFMKECARHGDPSSYYKIVGKDQFYILMHCFKNEPPHEKTCFLNAKTKAQISCTVTTQLISSFVFTA